ncbi:hypothetical protein [Pseudonocardia sp. TRM90224]|uniref:hypothetical protein n=1 Tax=Pseudonocardia sp. TRM90224 TaxID=2812678 RepID=UPI001E4E7867|nr:hypothetical protein [Pseudonocardia sp. TRM90224]
MRAIVVCALAVATLALGLLVLPWDWSVVPTAEPDVFASPVQPWQWTVAGIGLLLLSAASGAAGHPLLPLAGVAVPALAYWCWRSAAAEVIGANLWPVGAIMLAPLLAVVVLVGGGAGRMLTRRRASA